MTDPSTAFALAASILAYVDFSQSLLVLARRAADSKEESTAPERLEDDKSQEDLYKPWSDIERGLRGFRIPCRGGFYWVDTICIDRHGGAEWSPHVGMMRELLRETPQTAWALKGRKMGLENASTNRDFVSNKLDLKTVEEWDSIVLIEGDPRNHSARDALSQLSASAKLRGDKRAALMSSKTYGVIKIRGRRNWGQRVSVPVLFSQLIAAIPVILYEPQLAWDVRGTTQELRGGSPGAGSFGSRSSAHIRQFREILRGFLSNALPSSFADPITQPSPTTFVLFSLALSILLTIYHHQNQGNRIQKPALLTALTGAFALSVATWTDEGNLVNVIVPGAVIASLAFSHVIGSIWYLAYGEKERREQLAKALEDWLDEGQTASTSSGQDIKYLMIE